MVVVVIAAIAILGWFLAPYVLGNEVLLEAAPQPGPDPFTDPLNAEGVTEEAPPAQPQAPPAATGEVGGETVGLYGGSGRDHCEPEKLIRFLESDPAKAAAWAGVHGIQAADIRGFVGGLEPTVLNVDARVTNHGFKDGKATPRQSVLQAGTAVMVDSEGIPRLRCICGNPLLEPQAVRGRPRYTGDQWPDFQPDRVVAITTQAEPSSPTQLDDMEEEDVKENVLTNGGFESGLDGWGTGIYEPRESPFWGQASASGVVASDEAHGGSASFKIVNASPFAPQIYRTMSQAVDVLGGAEYCLSFWAKTLNAQPGILSFAFNDAWSDRIGLPPGTNDWTSVSHDFVTEDSNIDIRMITENTGTVWVDDVSLSTGTC